MGEEKRVLQIGGIAGLLAGVLSLVSVIIFAVLLQPPFATVEDFLAGFESRAAAIALGNALTLAAVITGIALVIALYRVLKGTSPEYALAGLLLFVAAAALIGVSQGGLSVFPGLAELYVDPDTTDAERTAIVQATIAASRVLTHVGFIGGLFVILGILSIGAVMVGNPSFGWGYGALTLLLGLVGLVLIVLSLFVPIGALGNVVFVILLFVFGWKVYSLSRAV